MDREEDEDDVCGFYGWRNVWERIMVVVSWKRGLDWCRWKGWKLWFSRVVKLIVWSWWFVSE